MGARRETIEDLTDALQELGRHDAAEVLAEARAAARARVRSILTDALTEAMLDEAREELLPSERSAPSRAQPTPEAREPTPEAKDATPAPADDDRDETAGHDPGTEPAWYVYGVVEAGKAPQPADLHDLGVQQSLAVVTEGELTAVVSRVPADEFAEDELRAHLNDMTWVESVALAHERVLDALCRQTTVIPMRLCTVYKTEGGVREMLRRESDALLETLRNLEGKVEWGVKVFFERRSASRSATREQPSREGASGAEYMDHRRRERDRGRQLDEQIEVAVAEIHERLDSLSEESTLNQPQRPEVSAHPGEMVLNGAYLVQRENESAFHEQAAVLESRFADIGIELVLTGPWPAYNFLPGKIGAAW
jgi:Gas vesicle synthesis protein GvpL/GvpF